MKRSRSLKPATQTRKQLNRRPHKAVSLINSPALGWASTALTLCQLLNKETSVVPSFGLISSSTYSTFSLNLI